MDKLSAEMFGGIPDVRVAGLQEYGKEISEVTRTIFGRALTSEDLVRLISPPNGSELLVRAMTDGGDLEIRMSYDWFDGTHNYILFVDTETGHRVIEFTDIGMRPEAPPYLETRLFARQVSSFRKFGIDQIWLYAEGHPNHPSGIVGYYVWARLGFAMDLGGLGGQLTEAGFADLETTLDLFEKEGGAKWWYNNGSERNAVFYLDGGSPCVLALERYLRDRGLSVDA